MTKEALGAIRIDLTVATAKLEQSLSKANKSFEGWASSVTAKLGRIESVMGRMGGKLTRSVTAPLAALSVVAIRATDDSERVTSSFRKLAEAMQASLKPVGDSLVRVIDTSVIPALQRFGGVVKELSDRFSRLEPQTQRAIVLAGAIAAAVGPVMLALSPIALSLFATAAMLKPLIGLMLSATVATVKWASSLKLLHVSIAAVAGFQFGRWLHDEFAVVQRVMARAIQVVQTAGAQAKYVFGAVLGWIRERWNEFALWMRRQVEAVQTKMIGAIDAIPRRLRSRIGLDDQTVAGLRSVVGIMNDQFFPDAGEDASARFRAEAEARADTYRAAVEKYAEIYNTTVANIEKEFDGKKRRGIGEYLFDDTAEVAASAARKAIEGINSATGGLIDSLTSLMDSAPLAFEAFEQAGAKMNPMLQKMKQEAMAIRLNVLSEENFREQLDRLEELRNLFPEIIDEQVFAAKLEELQKLLGGAGVAAERFSTKLRDTIQGFANSASETFTKLLFDGKASFRELADSWARTLVQMATQQLIFKPLFDALGTGISGVFANADGNAFDRGRVVPFAAGGVVDRPTYFGMRGGGLGLMGEAGPEAIMPLRRIGGRLGVQATGGGVSVQIIDQRGSGERPQVSETTGPDGRKMLQILIRDEVRRGIGEGAFDRTLGQSFGIGRRGRPR